MEPASGPGRDGCASVYVSHTPHSMVLVQSQTLWVLIQSVTVPLSILPLVPQGSQCQDTLSVNLPKSQDTSFSDPTHKSKEKSKATKLSSWCGSKTLAKPWQRRIWHQPGWALGQTASFPQSPSPFFWIMESIFFFKFGYKNTHTLPCLPVKVLGVTFKKHLMMEGWI